MLRHVLLTTSERYDVVEADAMYPANLEQVWACSIGSSISDKFAHDYTPGYRRAMGADAPRREQLPRRVPSRGAANRFEHSAR